MPPPFFCRNASTFFTPAYQNRISLLQRLRSSRSLLRPRATFRHNSTKTPTPAASSPAPTRQSPKKEGRFRQLTRKYGWAAVGVYLGLSALDLPLCFLAVRYVGSERIAEVEEVVVTAFWDTTEKVAPGSREAAGRWERQLRDRWREWTGQTGKAPVGGEMVETAVEEMAHQTKHHEASLATQLALAYALHKSLIFIRFPLTVAITPSIAKWLRRQGWLKSIPKT